jgi:hypothetical protein
MTKKKAPQSAHVDEASSTTTAHGTDAAQTTAESPTKKPGKKPATPKTKKAGGQAKEAQQKKLSALDAAAKVLQEAGQPMNCQDLITAMDAKGYWTSPAGKTPAATLYAAMTREAKIKGNQARFQKIARGQFAYQTSKAS